MRIVGVDPGVTGGLALIDGGLLHDVVSMPVHDSRADGCALTELLSDWQPEIVVVEDTHAMPGNGSIASFSLGLNTGIILGVVQSLSYPLVRVSPQKWKRQQGLWGKPKAASRGLATELFPRHAAQFKRVKDDGRAEAALIARWYAYTQIQQANAEATT